MVSKSEEFISARFLERIQVAHSLGCDALLRGGIGPSSQEPAEVAQMVEAHRWAWKPERVRLVLIAESHVYTSPADFATIYRVPSGVHAPNRYVRLIYCLAYGEKLLAPGLGGGTPQFWKIFGDLAGTLTTQRYSGPADARLRSWIETLRTLQKLGVWLLDSSLHGIYLGGGNRVDPGIVPSLQRIWWQQYGEAVLAETSPERIVAIGKGVRDSLQSQTDICFHDWIYQPQGARSMDQAKRNREVLSGLRSWLNEGGSGK